MASIEQLKQIVARKRAQESLGGGPGQGAPVPQTQPAQRQPIQEGVPFMTQDGPVILRGGQIDPITQEEADIITGKTQTAGDIARDVIPEGSLAFPRSGSSVVDFAGDVLTGTAEALPRALLTGAAAIGGAPVTGQDLAGMTAEIAIPLTGGVRGVARVAKLSSKLSKDELAKAPTTRELLKRGAAKIENYRKTGEEVSGDDLSIFWVKADDLLKKQGLDAENTPKLAARLNSIARRAEQETIDAQEMTAIRTGIRSTIKDVSATPDDKRLATILLDEFDEFTLTLPGGKGWQAGRREYAKGKKSQQIMDVLTDAQLTGSGLENGIRIELRKILKNKKKSLGFTTQEKDMMRRIVRGDFTSNTLKRLAKIGFGSGQQTNVLGGLGSIGIGGGAGSVIGGPIGGAIGAAGAPIVGAIAAKTLERDAVSAVKALRALAAGRRIPERIVFEDTALTPRILAAIGVAGFAETNEQIEAIGGR